jgi:hypothetical protein
VDPDNALPPPKPLNSANANDADALIHHFGEYLARCMYSPNWNLRHSALRYMSCNLDKLQTSELRDIVKYVALGLKDKVASVVVEAGGVLKEMVAQGGKFLPSIVQGVFPVLTERLGDGHTRVAVRCPRCLRESRKENV